MRYFNFFASSFFSVLALLFAVTGWRIKIGVSLLLMLLSLAGLVCSALLLPSTFGLLGIPCFGVIALINAIAVFAGRTVLVDYLRIHFIVGLALSVVLLVSKGG